MILFINFIFAFLICMAVFLVILHVPVQNGEVSRRIGSIAGTLKPLEAGRLPILKDERKSSFEWIESLISESGFYIRLHRLLVQAKSRQTAGGVLVAMFGTFFFTSAVVYFVTHLWMLAFLVGILAGCLPVSVLILRKNRNLRNFEAALPSAIEMCARSLRAGHSIAAAIGILAEQAPEPARSEFREVFKGQSHGLPLREALQNMLFQVPSRDLQIMVTGILVQKDTGGNLAEIMDRILGVIRDRLRIQGDIRTQTAQGRLTGWILCLLPVALLLFINLTNPGYSSVLFKDPTGKKFLYASIGLLLAGVLLITNIVRRSDI